MGLGQRSIKTRLFLYYFLLFAVFTVSVVLFQENRERRFKIASLESRLKEYTEVVERYIWGYQLDRTSGYRSLDSLQVVIPPEEIRITLISHGGEVLYDNLIRDYESMENHLDRREVALALRRRRLPYQGIGLDADRLLLLRPPVGESGDPFGGGVQSRD